MEVKAFVFKRLVLLFPILFGLLLLVFIISRVVPADPAALLAGPMASREQVESLRHQLGLDRPLYAQFLSYLVQLAKGDLGSSLYSNRPVVEDLVVRFPATMELTLVAMTLAIGLGIPLGTIAALRRNSMIDKGLTIFSVAGLSIASFWLGLMCQLFFGMYLNLLPIGGRIVGAPPTTVTGLYLLDSLITGSPGALWSSVVHLLLPGLTLSMPAIATIMRFTRSGVLDSLQRDYVLYERAMGLPERVVVVKYVLRNALNATIAQIGLIFGALLAGTVAIETVFDWPGLGLYAVSSILLFDYKAILGVTLISGITYVLVNLGVDMLLVFIDPRGIRRQEA